jgi:transcriptional regulator with XRE-family HTH domain
MPGFTYKSYSFIDKDPIIDYIRTIVEESGITYKEIEARSGVTAWTLRNWFSGKTKKPQAATINAVLRCIGYKLAPVPLNYPEEIRPTPYHTTPAKEQTPRNIMHRLEAKNKDPSWASIYGRPSSTKPISPDPVNVKGKIVPRIVQSIPPIGTKK